MKSIASIFIWALIVLAILVTPAQAAEIVVPAGDVDQLIRAINTANATAGFDEIIISGSFKVENSDNDTDGFNGFPVINSPITIRGNNAIFTRGASCSSSKIGARSQFRYFAVSNKGSLTIENITFTEGCNSRRDGTTTGGGALRNMGGSLNVFNSTFDSNNTYYNGGAISNVAGGTTIIENSIFINNVASTASGAVENLKGTIFIKNSQFNNNRSNRAGGAIRNRGLIDIENSSFVENRSLFHGGAIMNNEGASLRIINSTFSANTAAEWGGAIVISLRSTAEISYSTIINNKAAQSGGIRIEDVTTLKHSIIANNIPNNCELRSQWSLIEPNLTDDSSCTGFTFNVDPKLDGIGRNGGPTETHQFRGSSVAIDAVPPGECSVSTDQRGVSRPNGEGCDLGALEVDTFVIIAKRPSNSTPAPPAAGPLNRSLGSFDDNNNCRLDDTEFFQWIDLWIGRQIDDLIFFRSVDAWIGGDNICNVASAQPAIQIGMRSLGQEGVLFSDNLNLTSPYHVEIFGLNGSLAYSSQRTSDQLIWDLKNKLGQQVPNGIYFAKFSIRDESGRVVEQQFRKILVLR